MNYCNPDGAGGGRPYRMTSKITNANERLLWRNYWNEINQMYGTFVNYYVYDYSVSAHDFFYGEHPLAPFRNPIGMTMLTQFNNDSLLLSKFGIRTDADVTFIVPILTFRAAFGNNAAEPKAGDLVQLIELGWDRPGGVDDLNTLSTESTSCDAWKENITDNALKQICNVETPDTDNNIPNDEQCKYDSNYYSNTAYTDPEAFSKLVRGAPIFEITERRDENLTMNYNMLGGHYVWIMHAKRFDYSYQPNAPREPGHDQVSDETIYGKLSGGTNWSERPKDSIEPGYWQNIEKEKERIWDYDKRPGSNDSVYGNY